jgi:hypothetical protein
MAGIMARLILGLEVLLNYSLLDNPDRLMECEELN